MKTRQWLGREADSSVYVFTYIERRAFTPLILWVLFLVLGIELRVSQLLGKHSNIEPWIFSFFK